MRRESTVHFKGQFLGDVFLSICFFIYSRILTSPRDFSVTNRPNSKNKSDKEF